jgi:hypothetical protein
LQVAHKDLSVGVERVPTVQVVPNHDLAAGKYAGWQVSSDVADTAWTGLYHKVLQCYMLAWEGSGEVAGGILATVA